eukprot:gene2855-3547_t
MQKASEEPLLVYYNEITLLRRAIEGGLPGFEYLASSVTDFTTASPRNRDTFLQVYEEVIRNQNELAVVFKEFDKVLKQIIQTNTGNSPKMETIKQNMKSNYVSFLQQNLPKFKNIQNQVSHIEMNTATNVYIVLCRIAIDNQLNRDFWTKYGNSFQSTISTLRNDLFNATVKCGDNWDKHKNLIDLSICSTEKSHLNIQGNPGKEQEGTLLRKNIDVIHKVIEQINLRVKQDELQSSKSALQHLLNLLSKSYSSGLDFNSLSIK